MIEQSITPYITINDIRIGKNSWTASFGDMPADVFAFDMSLMEKALKSGKVNFEEDLKMELPLIEPGMNIMIRVTNTGPTIITLRGVWELITKDDDDPRLVTERDRMPHMIAGDIQPVVICADGSMWKLSGDHKSWKSLPSIPRTTKAALKSQEESDG